MAERGASGGVVEFLFIYMFHHHLSNNRQIAYDDNAFHPFSMPGLGTKLWFLIIPHVCGGCLAELG